MRKKFLMCCCGVGLAAAALAAATSAPAEVLENLGFFSDFELLSNLEILEDEGTDKGLAPGATVQAVAAPVVISTETVNKSTSTKETL